MERAGTAVFGQAVKDATRLRVLGQLLLLLTADRASHWLAG